MAKPSHVTIIIVVLAVLIIGGILLCKSIFTKKVANPSYIGPTEVTIRDGKMTPEILLALGRLSDPQVNPDGKKILYGVTYNSLTEDRFCRNLYICNIDGANQHPISFEGQSINNARWISNGNKIAFLQGGQIYTAPLKKDGNNWKLGKKKKISNIPAGISEFKLSPDQSQLIFVSSIQSELKKPSDLYADLNKVNAITTDDLMYRHWDHWNTEIPHSYISDIKLSRAGKNAITPENSVDILEGEMFELPSMPFSGIEQLAWSPCGKYIAYSCRKLSGKKYAFSTNTEIYLYNVEKKSTSMIEMGGGYDTDPKWSPDGKSIAFISMERDGYEADKQRLFIASLKEEKGDLPTVINTREIAPNFKYNVSGPVWSEDSKSIYFTALTEGINAIYKLEVETSEIARLTDQNQWNDFGSPFHVSNEGGKTRLLTYWASMNFPTELVAVDIDGGKPSYTPITEVNEGILKQLSQPKTEARMIETVDGKEMLTWVMYPPNFDPAKKYPSILICLGGPQGTISQGWSYRWNYRLMASQGYIVVLPNRRGTTAFGQEWTEQISGDYSGLNIQDYLSAAKELKAEPFVDKMAATGASYGGYSVYYLAGVHGGVFDAFIAHAGIFNQEHMYQTTEEMWFPNFDNGGMSECKIDPKVGTPLAPVGPKGDGETFGGIYQPGSPWSTKPEAKRHYANSPHKLVTNWNTPIMVIHGGSDFRVPLEQGMAAYNSAQMMGVPSRLLVFPEENHWILKPQNSIFWHREYFKWLDMWCK